MPSISQSKSKSTDEFVLWISQGCGELGHNPLLMTALWKKWYSGQKKPLAKSRNILKSKADKILLSANGQCKRRGKATLKSLFCGAPNQCSKSYIDIFFQGAGSTNQSFDWIFQFRGPKLPRNIYKTPWSLTPLNNILLNWSVLHICFQDLLFCDIINPALIN